jgi:hypothetical protein
LGKGAPQLEAADGAGEFYGRMTLRQLRRQFGKQLPACVIEDWPDFPARGVMLDISRDKVPTMTTLFALVDELAEWKINQLQLYTEHTFAYRHHRRVWQHASPLTAAEIRRLDAHCRRRFIELVPNQNSFGHFERWLKHTPYRALGAGQIKSCLDPANPSSLALLAEMYDELLPNFASRQFNVGCDETYGIGGRTYLDFLLQVYRLVKRHGRTMQFWGDIVLQHPELIAELPRDLIALEWGYEADHKFAEHCARFAAAGVPFYVCPGTSTWNSFVGRTDNCLASLRNAAVNGQRFGARGFLNTDWGDGGHWQYLPASYLGFAAGAAYSWCYQSNHDLDLVSALNVHVFRDAAGVMGRLAYDLGNAHLAAEQYRPNGTVVFDWLREPRDHKSFACAKRAGNVRAAIEAAMSPLPAACMDRPDAALIRAEFTNAARMMRAGCACAEGRQPALRKIIAEHRRLWLARNRPGGLADSCRVLRQA